MNKQETSLLAPVRLGAIELPNRVIMSPMTRLRTDADLAPQGFVADYYGQRATASLIVTESIAIQSYGDGWPPIPGMFTEDQQRAWRHVVETVHERGGRIAAQLWHVGHPRIAQRPGFSALAEELAPHDLDTSEIAHMSRDFEAAARIARSIGFDAVEIHNGSANLLDRFLRPAANLRNDEFGGSVENRSRLLCEIVSRVADAVGSERVGVKFSPSAPVAGAADAAALETFAYLLGELSRVDLAYVHATRVTQDDRDRGWGEGISFSQLRNMYSGRLIGAGDFTPDTAQDILDDGTLDAVVFGRLFLTNPDLPRRIALSASLNAPNRDTFYTAGSVGLTDYPVLAD